MRSLLRAAAAALVLAYLRNRWRPFPVTVAGDSMRPTLAPGERLLVTERGEVRPGVVVSVSTTDRELVKRVMGVGGDRVRVGGDNRTASTDSRAFGSLPRTAVTGVVRAVYWPPRSWRVIG